MDGLREYPTLTALMEGREPGSVKARKPDWPSDAWFRPGYMSFEGVWGGMSQEGGYEEEDDAGPWLLVSEDQPLATTNTVDFRVIQAGNAVPLEPAPPALDVVRLQMAATILAGMHANPNPAQPRGFLDPPGVWASLALAEADALIAEARK